MILALLLRTYLYMSVRMQGTFILQPLRETEVSLSDTVLMAVQELAMNFVLLSYFYGIDLKENPKDDTAFMNSIVDGLIERPTVITIADSQSNP